MLTLACFSRVPYTEIFGGVTAFKPEHFELVNGFSNRYYGWGGEDDDMYNRSVCCSASKCSYFFHQINSLIIQALDVLHINKYLITFE